MILNGGIWTDHKVDISSTFRNIRIKVLVHIFAYSKPLPGDLILPFNDKGRRNPLIQQNRCKPEGKQWHGTEATAV